MAHTDPIDSFSEQLTRAFWARFLPRAECRLIYPGADSVPLQRIGELLGWGQVSPLGIGISQEYGLWFAYRTAFLTSAKLPLSPVRRQQSPCESCVDKPCIRHCPASAVEFRSAFDISACFKFRLGTDSPCVDKCAARLACPVGTEHRYPSSMMRYIYRFSMRTVRDYQNGKI